MWQRHEKGIRDGKESYKLDVILTRFHEEGESLLSFLQGRGTWVAQSVQHQTPDFFSALGLRVMTFNLCTAPPPHVRLSAGGWSSVLTTQWLRFSLSFSLSLCTLLCKKRKKKKGRREQGRTRVEKRGGVKPGRRLERKAWRQGHQLHTARIPCHQRSLPMLSFVNK